MLCARESKLTLRESKLWWSHSCVHAVARAQLEDLAVDRIVLLH